MKAVIMRTSTGWDHPCEEAKKEKIGWIDWRAAPLEKMREDDPNWFKKGRDHREEEGYSRRTLKEEYVYTISFETLDQLLSFVKKYGECILIPTKDYEGIEWEIEIYDTFRE